MKTFLTKVLGGLLTSKKFMVLIAGAIGLLLAKFKLNIDPTTIQEYVGLVIAYIVGQGIADHGKEAAKIQAEQ